MSENPAAETLLVLNALKENIIEGVAIFDRERCLIEWNQRYAELCGLEPQRLAQRISLTEIAALAGANYVLADIPSSHAAFATEVRRADGLTVEVRGRPIAPDKYMLTYTDVTGLRNSELAFRNQAVRLTAILDNLVDAIITINESGSIESWSKGAQRMFGYDAHEVLRRNVRMLMPEPHSSAHDGYLRRYMQTGEKRIIGQRRAVEARRKDGTLLPVDLGISEMIMGERRLFIGIIRDITERREVERLKSGFVSTVSHELRTPLTSISGSLGLVAGGAAGELPDKAQRLIQIARQNCERLVRLINDILDVEKAESGKLDLRLRPHAILSIIEEAIEINRAYAASFGARIECQAPKGGAEVFVDIDRMIQVLTNLISNAAKFSPAGGTIHVSCELEKEWVQVAVRDEGPGIPIAFHSRLFQRFAQADSSDARSKGGTGLGLSIVKSIVEQLGGSVAFISPPGQGTTFTVRLPRYRAQIEPAPFEPAGLPYNVLICEDDPDVAEIIAMILQRDGMHAHIVADTHQARAALHAVHFDLALIDVHLPDEDGLNFIAQLRADDATRALPVIVLSAVRPADVSSTVDRTALHIADWLQKPIEPRRLLRTIHGALAVEHSETAHS